MKIYTYPTSDEAGAAAAELAAAVIQKAVIARGEANIILATGASQFNMLKRLITLDVEWSKVSAFHLDEYIGLPSTHPASFRGYLKQRFVEPVGNIKAFHYVNGDHPKPAEECERLEQIIGGLRIDLACIGIGENGHIAFNDPPADFKTEEPYIIVRLDDACRKQQLGEGWFPNFDSVPRQAISMSIRQIMKSDAIICTVPDERKAEAVRNSVEGPVTNHVPASILQQHDQCALFLDSASASLLQQ
jgi:glucosamine-6-phosphate deaminase